MQQATSVNQVVSGGSIARASVLHVMEATLGGTMRYMSSIIEASVAMPFSMSLAYSTERAGSGLLPALTHARSSAWALFNLQMTRSVRPVNDLQNMLKLRRIIRDLRPDIVHCHSSKAGAIGRLATLALRRPPRLIYSPHAVAANLGTHYLLIERGLSRLTDRFAAVSESERQEIADYGIASYERTDVVYPVIDTAHFSPEDPLAARRALGFRATAPLILGIGRLTAQKDPLAFVQVIERLRAVMPDVTAVWVGDGELRVPMEDMIHVKGLEETIRIAGWQEDVRPYLAACDVLVSTSQFESFGYMVAEALAMERPVVATAVTGTRDIMSKDLTALLYEPGDHGRAAQLVSELLSDSFRARALGAVGRRLMVDEFSLLRMTNALYACYRNILDADRSYSTKLTSGCRSN